MRPTHYPRARWILQNCKASQVASKISRRSDRYSEANVLFLANQSAKNLFSRAYSCSKGQDIPFKGSGKSITVATGGRHNTTSLTSGIPPTPSYALCGIFIILLLSHLLLGLQSGHFRPSFPTILRTVLSFSQMGLVSYVHIIFADF
jgi:hypothetical protein